MKKFPIVLDLETKYTFREFDDPQKLEVSVAAIYDYQDHQGKIYFEKDLNKLFPLLESASYIIGYNVRSFDLAVLQHYYPGKVDHFSCFDILDDIKEKLGRRLSLNDVISATLGKKKSGHGLMAIDYYKEGKFEKLKKYCLDDVILTKELFDYGVKTGEIFYFTSKGKGTIKVSWKKYIEEDGENGNMPLTLPF
ncbi:MAG: ribonuclease H-like domain-containing protein [Candidatus Roizmanbacteria bacterium]|nr:MAG: ribonuclease H-like domain-containing protein [Candidatus Roizmanbacteria bacterium]